jgi:hypothetical protein
MSMRCVLTKPIEFVRTSLVLGLVMLLLGVVPVSAQDSSGAMVSISSATDVGLGQPLTLDVTLTEVVPAMPFGGFDLLIAWDPSTLSLTQAVPGSMLDTCGWEYFTFNTDATVCPEWPLGNGMVRVVALADLNNGDVHPNCYGEFPGQLAELNFLTTSSPDVQGTTAPVRFLWCDCGDNGFGSLGGDSLWISDRVYEFGQDITDPYMDLPSYFGARVECPDDSLNTFRGIDYSNGWIEFVAEDTLDAGPSIVLNVNGGESSYVFDTVEVQIDMGQSWPTQELGGFDFLIQHQLHKLNFLSAAPGQLLDDCGWEYFTYAAGSSANCGGEPCPESVVRVVALADLNNGEFHPTCYADVEGELATLEYEILDDSSAMSSDSVFLDWVWYDCGDNSISDRGGDTLLISDRVYDAYHFDITADTAFPTRFGAQDECIPDTGSSMVPARRHFDFQNGQGLVSYIPGINHRGDVNLNDLSYEIADWVLFANYFTYGLEVFNVDVEAQVGATDTNADGLTLTLADLVYLFRVIIGDALPVDKGEVTTDGYVVLTQDSTAGTILIASDDDVTALYLVFDSDVQPEVDLPDHDGGHYFDGSNTRLLIHPALGTWEELPLIPSGTMISYTGDANLVAAQAANDGVTIMTTQILGSGSCCQMRGNVDGQGPGQIDIADLIYMVTFMFQEGPPPPCMSEADVNGDGSDNPDIADLIHLVQFMFQDGPAPAACP